MERRDLPSSDQSSRFPLWLWLNFAAMAASTLHILVDMGVGLFPIKDDLSFAEGAVLLLVTAVQVWWCISLVAGSHGDGGGLASLVVLALGWTTLANGSAIVFCLPICPYAAPLADVAHVGSIVLGVVAALFTIWTLWRRRLRLTWVLPCGALVLVLATIVALASAGPD